MPTSRPRARALRRAALALVFIVACNDPLSVRWFELPPPSTSLDPDSVRPPRILYICDQWLETPPHTAWVVVDVLFSGGGSGPTESQLREVARVGAQVGYMFPFQAVRIRIGPSSIPELYRATRATVYIVPDQRRYDWWVAVMYTRDLTTADDSVFTSLGGQVTHRLLAIRQLLGVLPVQSNAVLRTMPGVAEVEPYDKLFCNEASVGPRDGS